VISVLYLFGLQRFFVEEKPFPVDRTDLKIIAGWRYECEKMDAKFVRTTSTI